MVIRLILSIWIAGTVGLTPAVGQQLQRDPQRVKGGLVVSIDPIASKVGAQILLDGGNAVDAAIATSFALAVTHPEAGNIGGGGFMVVRLAKNNECFAVDYRETAPKRATPTMFLGDNGQVDPEKVNIGWLVVGVPGTPHGLWTAHQKAGSLPWKDLVMPAVKLARDGFVVDDYLSRGLASQEKDFRRFEEPARVFYPDGKPPKSGSMLKQPDLAETLERIAEEGPRGFYEGETAARIDAAMRKFGGLVTTEDLASYKAVLREPVRGTYRDLQIVSICPPSSGGISLINMLNILEGYDLRKSGHNTPQTIHLLAEAMKRAYYDRAKYLGDPDFVEIPVQKLLSKEHATKWRQSIGQTATSAVELGADLLQPAESPSTTHFSVIDRVGNMVSTTTTLEGSYGAKVMAPGTGFLLNNEMHDFNVKPGETNESGLIGTPPNLIEPGKRMLSSMTPTLVLKDNQPYLVVGSPGGRTIINTVLQVILNVVDHQMPIQQAVDAGRLHHQWLPDTIVLENRIPETVVAPLEQMGHRVRRTSKQGDSHAIFIDPESKDYVPGVDRRRRGGAYGF